MKKLNWSVAGVAGLVLVATAACGTGGSGSDGSGKIDTGSAAFAAAKARVAQFTAPQALTIPIDTPVTVPKRHLTIAYTQCSASVCTEIGASIAKAAAALGATYKPFFHQDTPETVQAAFQNAIQAKADIVLTSGDPVQWYQKQLDTLHAQGAAVVAWSIPGGYKLNGIAANLLSGDDYYLHGVLMADYAATKAKDGKADVLFLGVPSYPVLKTLSDGFKAEMAKVCPKCNVTTVDATIPDVIAGNVPATAVAAIQRHPGVNYIVGAFGGLITNQLSKALTTAGLTDIPMISAAGTQANYDLIRSGQQQADLAIPSGLLGWRAVDAGLRALSGADVGTYKSTAKIDLAGHPDALDGGVTQLFVEKSTAPVKSPFENVEGYEDAYKKLWGLTGA